MLTFPLKDLHPYDIHLFWADVRERVKQQVFAESSCPAAGTTLSKNRCFKSQACCQSWDMVCLLCEFNSSPWFDTNQILVF